MPTSLSFGVTYGPYYVLISLINEKARSDQKTPVKYGQFLCLECCFLN